MKKKRFLAIFLVLTMLVSLMPMGFAEDLVEDEPQVEEELVIEEPEEVAERAADPEEEYVEEPPVAEEPAEELDSRGGGSTLPTVQFVSKIGDTVQKTYTVQNLQTTTATYQGQQVNAYYVLDTEIAAARTAVSVEGYDFEEWAGLINSTKPGQKRDAIAAAGETWVYDYVTETFTITANLVANQYKVSYVAEPANVLAAAKVPAQETVAHNGCPLVKLANGTNVTEDVITVTGYGLDIYVGSTKLTGATVAAKLAALRAAAITAETVVTLKYTADDNVAVSFIYNGATQDSIVVGEGGTRPTGSNTVTYDVTFNTVVPEAAYNKAPTSVNEGEEFIGWDKGDHDYTAVTKPITTATDFTAVFALKKFTVTYVGYDKTETVEWGKTAKGYTPTDIPVGQTFLGWNTTEGATTTINLEATPIKADTNLYPVIGNTKTVHFDLDGGKYEEKFADQKVIYDTVCTNPGAPTKFGYHFVRWDVYDTASGKWVAFDFTTHIKEDTTLKAEWAGDTFRLAIDTTGIAAAEEPAYGGTKITKAYVDEIETYDVATAAKNSFTVKALTATGHTFDGYQYMAEGATTATPVAVNATVTLSTANLPLVSTGENEWTLTLTPVSIEDFWVVSFNVNNANVEVAGTDATKTLIYNATDESKIAKSFKVAAPEGTPSGGTKIALKENNIYTINSVKWFLDGWYTGAVENANHTYNFDNATKWNFDDNVTGHTNLVANWLPLQTVTFTLNESGAAWVDATDLHTRSIPKGMTFAQMAALAALNKEGQTPVNNLVAADYVFPEATREGYGDVVWKNGTIAFTTSTAVSSDLTLKDSWGDPVTWTVTYNPNGGELTHDATEKVLNNKTINKKSDPTREGFAFVKWTYLDENNHKQDFVFVTDPSVGTPTKVTGNMTLTAEWKSIEAKIGDVPYETLADAFEATKTADSVQKATVKLVRDIDATNTNYTVSYTTQYSTRLDFGNYTISGGTFNFDNGVFIKSGTFDGTKFVGTSGKFLNVDGGLFTGVTFKGVKNENLRISDTAKFDADSASALNEYGFSDSNTNILAVVNSDGYYTKVAKKTVTFNFAGATSGRVPIKNVNVVVGAGETPAHAITELVERGELAPTVAAQITSPKADDKAFVAWTADNRPFDLNKAVSDNCTAIATWKDTLSVTFIVGYAGVDPQVVTADQDAQGKATFDSWDCSELIAQYNGLPDTKYPDEFECWVDNTGKKVTFPLTVEASTTVTARMKTKLVFEEDLTSAPVIVQANHEDRYSAYWDQIPTVPKGSENWINKDTRVELSRTGIINNGVDGVITFVPVFADKTNWDLIAANPDNGFTYSYDDATATGTVSYKGTEAKPIVVKGVANKNANVTLEFTIEAPSAVKGSDQYEVQFDNGIWTVIGQGGTSWDPRSVNNNLTFIATKTLTMAQIKSAADSKSVLNFSVKFREKGSTAPCATFNVSFDPANVRFVDNNGSPVFVISNNNYKFTLSFNTDGGTEIDPITVEYGEEATVPATATKQYSDFVKWVDKDGKDVAAGQIVMTKDVEVTAQWKEQPVIVTITNGDDTSKDTTSFVMSDPLSGIALPRIEEPADKVFDKWQYNKNASTAAENDWVAFEYEEGDAIGSLATKNASGKDELPLRSHFVDATTVNFHNDRKNPLKIKVVAGELASKVYYDNKDAISAAEKAIPGFKFWTSTAPNNGGWNAKPAEYKFDDTAIVENLYPYAEQVNVTFVIGGDVENEVVTLAKGSTVKEVLDAAPVIEDTTEKKFDGWFDSVGKAFDKYADTWTLTARLTLTAHYSDKEQIEVTFKDGEKEDVVVKLPEGSSPADVLDAAPEIKDDNFIGWYDGDVEFTKELVGWTLKEPLTLTAKYFAEVEFVPTLNLADYTGVRVYIDLPEGADASEYTAEWSYKTYRQEKTDSKKVSELPVGKAGTKYEGMYLVDALRAASTEMSDTVTVKLTKGNEVVKTETFTVKGIADKMIEDGADAPTALVLNALKQYGYYGQKVFHNKEDDLPNIDDAPALVAIPDDYASSDPTTFGAYVTKFEDKLDLNSATKMNLYFTLADGYTANDFTFTVLDKDGQAYTKCNVTGTTKVKVQIEGILSPQLARNFQVVVTLKSDTTKTATWTRSAIACAYTYQQGSNNDVNVPKLMQSLYQYYLASAALFPQYK